MILSSLLSHGTAINILPNGTVKGILFNTIPALDLPVISQMCIVYPLRYVPVLPDGDGACP